MQTRKVVTGLIDDCHTSTVLCHLANISYLIGAEKSNGVLAEAVRSDPHAREACARTIDHLRANAIDIATTATVLGARLRIDGATETVVGAEEAITTAASRCPIMKRTGRGAFAIPEISKLPSIPSSTARR